MNDLVAHLDRYLTLRRCVGFQLTEHARVLPDFVGYAWSRGDTTVRAQSAVAWALSASTDGQAARRLSMVRGFARYLVAFDPATEIPARALTPNPPGRSTPHIYTDEEVARLIRCATVLRPAGFGATVATMIGLLAATGLRPAEARRLDRSHVDLANAQLSVWHSKSGRSRRVPLHPSTVDALGEYATTRDGDRDDPHPDHDAFFPGRDGARLTAGVAARTFAQLRSDAGIVSRARRRQPVLGDLRHTFAVSTLLDWHRDGTEVERRLPTLSAYLGHVNPAQTYWYLEGTPELMALVAERLERTTGALR